MSNKKEVELFPKSMFEILIKYGNLALRDGLVETYGRQRIIDYVKENTGLNVRVEGRGSCNFDIIHEKYNTHYIIEVVKNDTR